ncbi:MAG: prepilin-type N-terminal cleavage/methylation domain-containing protein [Candidatus Latescibacteria bacterium]|jgi:prepilin-type N-terminal cleavage/methylation domain-containing protein|nr:prepilin-type N-terminal cleavage/methylation domain-containing protein [bacterium]MBD3423829.1 prepilin-type N-terminal cleavage/methylation domain-containing protein [Candidatus Latescibacterota bacterium]
MIAEIRKLAVSNREGMTLVEVLVGMTIFAIGLLGLSQVMFGVIRSNMSSKNTGIATNLAHQRLEQIMSSTRYGAINAGNFPDEDYGQIGGGASEFQKFKRTVAIADSTNALGNSVMKEITVRVEWRDRGKLRDVELNSSICRFKDVSL